jgi:hypothetical protein
MITPSTDTWLEWKSRTLDEQQRLCACIDACLSCELVCAISADVATTFDDAAYGNRTASLVLACGKVCHDTARAITELKDPDVGAVAQELEACLRACAAARVELERRLFDQCCRVCAEQCSRCETECEACLRLVSVAA